MGRDPGTVEVRSASYSGQGTVSKSPPSLVAGLHPRHAALRVLLRRAIVCCLWLAAIISLPAAPAAAQRIPDLGYMFPPGGRAGTTIEVRLGGYDWTPDMDFFVLDPRVRLVATGPPGELLIPPPPYWFGPKSKIVALPLPREVPARFTIPADMPLGIVYWQAANANGGTATGMIVVSDGPEAVEDERRQGPQLLADVPVTVSGRLSKVEEIDSYRFVARRAGPISCDLLARRLGVNFHGVLTVRDKAGRLVADAVDAEGQDVALTFAAEAGGEYTVNVRDIDHAGDRSYVYRLGIASGPRVLAAIPAAGRRGETRSVEFIGVGVATGLARLESVVRQVTFPVMASDTASKQIEGTSNGLKSGDFSYGTRVGEFDYRLETPFGAAPAFSLVVSDLPETVDGPRADDQPRMLALPAAVTGVLDRPAREDRFAFAAKKGEVWSISLEARRIGSPLDVALAVVGPDGKELAQSDDLPGTTDAGLDFTAPADGLFGVVVSDRSGRGGARDATYRLVIRPPVAGFSLQTLQRVNVLIGDKTDLIVKATRTGGFTGPITLAFEGLPPGVRAVPPTVPPAGGASATPAASPSGGSSVSPLVIPADKSQLTISLQADAGTTAAAALVRIIGTAKVGEANVTQAAMCPAAGSLIPRTAQANDVSQLLVTSMMRPRCKGMPVDQDTGRKVNRGSTFPAEVIVERLEGYTGEVVLKMAARQSYQVQGITGQDVRVPPGAGHAIYPCFMPEWLETSRTSRMAMIGTVQVADPTGRTRHLVVEMTGMITMSIEGALLKLSHASRDLAARPGQPFDVRLRISRSAKIPEPARIELRLPDELAGLFSAEPLVVPPGQEEALLQITPAADTKLTGLHTLVIRATVLQNGYLPAVSETKVSVEFPPSLPAR